MTREQSRSRSTHDLIPPSFESPARRPLLKSRVSKALPNTAVRGRGRHTNAFRSTELIEVTYHMAYIQVQTRHRTMHQDRRFAAFCIWKCIHITALFSLSRLHPFFTHLHLYLSIFALVSLYLFSQELVIEASSRAESASYHVRPV